MRDALNLKEDVNRMYVNRGEGGRGSMSVENVVSVEEHSLSNYLIWVEVNLDWVVDAFIKEKKTETE